MALSEFEIAMGGFTSIPILSGLIFLGYKSFGEGSLDTSKLKPKTKPAVTKETPTPENNTPKTNNQKPVVNINTTTAIKEKKSAGEQPRGAKEETSISSKSQPKHDSKAIPPNQKTE